MRIKKTVYTQSFAYAREHNELDAYRKSGSINRQCAVAIDNAINESNYDTNRYKLDEAAQKVIDLYGPKRVTWVLASTVNTSWNDGRYSSSNKEWAKGFDTLKDHDCHVRSHPCLVDGFVTNTRELVAGQEKARAEQRQAKRSIVGQLQGEKETPEPQSKYELVDVMPDENALFYSTLKPERDMELGSIGYLRADFGRSGNEFWPQFFDHCADFKTQAFRAELDNVINALRDGGPLQDRDAMSAFCYANKHAMLDDGRNNNFGFKIKTDSHVFYMRFNATRGDYNLYCYIYERDRLEKCFPALADAKPSLIGQVKNLTAAIQDGPEVVADETRARLEKAVEHIVKKCADETQSGSYIVYDEDIPPDILEPGLFAEHIKDIAAMMLEYESVAEANVDGDCIDSIMYLAYCPNYEPSREEIESGEYPDDRAILDPLTKIADAPEREQNGSKPKKKDVAL